MTLRPPVFDGTLLAGGGALIALGRGTASASMESVSPPGNLSPRNLKANKRKQHQQHCRISLSCVKGSPVPLMELLGVKVSGAPDTVAGLGAARLTERSMPTPHQSAWSGLWLLRPALGEGEALRRRGPCCPDKARNGHKSAALESSSGCSILPHSFQVKTVKMMTLTHHACPQSYCRRSGVTATHSKGMCATC